MNTGFLVVAVLAVRLTCVAAAHHRVWSRADAAALAPDVSAYNTTALLQVLNAKPLEECLKTDAEKCYRDPTVWGPPTWFFLHSMTLSLPPVLNEDRQQAVKQLMYDLQRILPCPSCGVHLKENMEELPIEPHLKTRDELIDWMISIHNKVNANCNKKQWTRDEMLAVYNKAFDEKYPDGFNAVLGFRGSAATRHGADTHSGAVRGATFVTALLAALTHVLPY
eukprot:NODE_15693_length_1036_cov_2.990099.p1 GENE.NODE_15693_length_1036_cov_2.990099~~NODE_15693_length_1036_cov_2.990099.p1  ORF type:complete len:223 (-),score=75.66 NODE_15693_length_1036_cov_2.990099:288-956(-)